MLQKSFCKLDIKDVGENGSFEGNIAVFNNVDLGNDKILKGAFANSLKDIKANGMPPVLWQHSWSDPIGVYTHLEETDEGLFAKGQLVMEVQRAKEAHALLKARAVGGLSIGFVRKKHRYDGNVRLLEEVQLMEASIVTFPMNPKARVLGVKSIRDFETMLVRDAGFTRSEAQVIINQGYKSLGNTEDEDDTRDAGVMTPEIAEAFARLQKSTTF